MVQGARPWGWHADRVGQEAGPCTAPGDSLAPVTHTAVTHRLAASTAASTGSVAGLSAAQVAAVRELLVGSALPGSQAGRVAVLRCLEDLKASIAAVQARVV